MISNSNVLMSTLFPEVIFAPVHLPRTEVIVPPRPYCIFCWILNILWNELFSRRKFLYILIHLLTTQGSSTVSLLAVSSVIFSIENPKTNSSFDLTHMSLCYDDPSPKARYPAACISILAETKKSIYRFLSSVMGMC